MSSASSTNTEDSLPARPVDLTELTSRTICATIGSCSCGTKSPQVKQHLPTCRFRVLSEVLPVLGQAAEWDRLFQAFILETAFPGTHTADRLWPNPKWSQEAAMIAHMLYEGLRIAREAGLAAPPPPPKKHPPGADSASDNRPKKGG